MSKIIGIHGLSNKPERKLLAQWWEAAIAEGLERNRGIHKGATLSSVYWADVMYPDGHDENPERYERTGTEPLKQYKDSWVDDVGGATAVVVASSLYDDERELEGYLVLVPGDASLRYP